MLDPDLIQSKLAALTRRRLKINERAAAVLLPLGLVDDEPAVLFTKRTETLSTHKGQVSFPGGMRDPDDQDATDTALRELEEEIGLPRTRVRPLGLFHEVPAITGTLVTPVIGWLGAFDLDELEPNPAEIDEIFALTLRELEDPATRYQRSFTRDGKSARMTVFDGGPHPVWGLTAYILECFLVEVLGMSLSPGLAAPRDNLGV